MERATVAWSGVAVVWRAPVVVVVVRRRAPVVLVERKVVVVVTVERTHGS